MRPLRAPWPFHVASVLTWAMVGLPAIVRLAARPAELAEPVWVL
jgi:hypothetical protein